MQTIQTHAEPVVAAGRARARRWPALVALAAVVTVALAAWVAERPPQAAGPDAPATSFSAGRAWPHLERIAGGGPTPIGSPGAAAIRDHLVAELTKLGLKTEVQRGLGAHAFEHQIISGLAENVVAVLPGTDSSGPVLVGAHYDSTVTTPGTSDDKASVAAVLEIARALTSGPRPRNDVVFLLSDGEEPGLIGAELFARHPSMRGGGAVMINLEGPGNAAPSSVYNVTPGGGGLVESFARSVPHPVGESAVIGAYRSTGFHSDLSALEEYGVIGVDLGFADGRGFYHHPRDTVAEFSKDALQMHGDNALAMIKDVAGTDLRALRQPRHEVFIGVFGLVVRYPAALITPLAWLAVLAVLGLAVLTRLRRVTGVPRLLGAVAATLVPVGAGIALAMGMWSLLVSMEPAYGALMSDPYQPWPYRLAIMAGCAAVVWGWYALLRRWLGADAPVVGALFWQAVLGVAGAMTLPGTSYYGAVPALAGAIGAGAALVLRARRPVLALVVQAAATVPGVVLFTVGGRSVGSALGLVMPAPMAVFYVFAALSLLPLLAAVTPEARPRSATGASWTGRIWVAAGPLLSGVTAVGLFFAGVAVNAFGPDQPRTSHLAYVLDSGTGRATWMSAEPQPGSWAAERVPDVPASWTLPLPYGGAPARTGPAPAVPLPAPELTIVSERREGDATVLRVRMRSARQAGQLNLHADRRVSGGTIEVAGQSPLPIPGHQPGRGPWPFELQFFAPPGTGVEIELRVPGTERPRLAVTDLTMGLESIPGHRARPADVDLMPSMGSLPTDSVSVVRVL
ncbi:M20/M25/M40 family metallo-hydrolase [Nonomuraea sp. NN258]|uniref:M28 family peptidase n=1 Tax=Nonomuraea antri TaxID=2730852 RepID=UPI001567E3F9|nr:M28 family peptidase [Nonomuraea antri]NRQ40382.1 M20/M25/M40 family metallo-hydrolase [Nonomuraea antri]